MRETEYLIVGGGMTGHAAAAAIREVDARGRITMLSAEADRPYARPPLSKGLWLGKSEQSVWLPDVQGLDLLTGRRALALDPIAREVRDDQGDVHRLRAPPPRDRRNAAAAADRAATASSTCARSPTTAGCTPPRAAASRSSAGGFIGSEIAAALASSGQAGDDDLPGGGDRVARLPGDARRRT